MSENDIARSVKGQTDIQPTHLNKSLSKWLNIITILCASECLSSGPFPVHTTVISYCTNIIIIQFSTIVIWSELCGGVCEAAVRSIGCGNCLFYTLMLTSMDFPRNKKNSQSPSDNHIVKLLPNSISNTWLLLSHSDSTLKFDLFWTPYRINERPWQSIIAWKHVNRFSCSFPSCTKCFSE